MFLLNLNLTYYRSFCAAKHTDFFSLFSLLSSLEKVAWGPEKKENIEERRVKSTKRKTRLRRLYESSNAQFSIDTKKDACGILFCVVLTERICKTDIIR